MIEEDENSHTKPPSREEFNKTRIDDEESMIDEKTGGKTNYTEEDIDQGKGNIDDE